MTEKIVIISDLDGTLLHPDTYAFDEAKSALKMVEEHDVALVLCSSKTRGEIEVYRKQLDNVHPFVAENGGGIFIPKGYFPFHIDGVERDGFIVIDIGIPYKDVRKIFCEIKEKTTEDVKGFGDMSVDEVAEVSGMTVNASELAKQREYDEPFIFKGPDEQKQAFFKFIEDRGLTWTEGWFSHILGNHDKGKAAKLLKDFYKKVFGDVITIGIGDGLNDVPLLKAVDYPVLLPKKNGDFVPGINISGLERPETGGPAGWNIAIPKILRSIFHG